VFRKKEIYEFVGYSSYYPFYHYPDLTRMRISQFMILPPFQRQGHGKRLYKFMYEMFRHDKRVVDFTIEDPNDTFQDMRDCVDVSTLLDAQVLKDVEIDDIPYETLKEFKFCKVIYSL
jgi:histone acetyltransferase 1